MLVDFRTIQPKSAKIDQTAATLDTKNAQYGWKQFNWRDNENKETQDKEDLENKNGIQVADSKTVIPWSRGNPSKYESNRACTLNKKNKF